MLMYVCVYIYIYIFKLVHYLSWKKISITVAKLLVLLLPKEGFSDFIFCVNEIEKKFIVL